IFAGEDYFRARPSLCNFIGCICLWTCFASVWNILAVAICRYTCIVHCKYYDKIYTHCNSILFCVLVWVIAMALNSGNFGWSEYTFERKTRSCLWSRMASFSYTLFFSLFAVGVPMIATLYLYILTFKHVWDSARRIQSHKVNSEETKKLSTAYKGNLKLAKTMALIYAGFLFNWGPYVVIISADPYDKFSPYVHGISLIFAHFNSSLNTLIYGFTNPTFREAYIRILGLEKCLKQDRLGSSKATLIMDRISKVDISVTPNVTQ
ncbi:Melatonin receptor, partial [Cichlidogyrus casuarinus]